ncbi:MAG TPA: S41 family peptidase [Daejeonella sp.]|nr:S41 family peptidase [Daejeonella sp.]
MLKVDILSATRYFLFFTVLLLLFACKKEPKPAPNPVPPTTSRIELTKDSIFLYAKEVYLWNDVIPTYDQFKPRNYLTYSRELFGITQLKINPETGKPYEFTSDTATATSKYSYITEKTPKKVVASAPFTISAVTLDGIGDDFGVGLTAVGLNTAYDLYIRYVNQGSPADKAGLKRGDIVTRINNRSFGTDYPNEVGFINSAFNQQTISLVAKRANGQTFDLQLNRTIYNSSPIFKDSVLTVGAKKIGYIAFARFSNSSNSEPVLLEAFSKFAAAGVTDVVVDLRYNGGGYVTTAQYLANLIAPAAMTGQVMFSEYYNSNMQGGKAPILKNQPLLDGSGNIRYSNGRMLTYADVDYSISGNTMKFSKVGSLEGISNVVFITTGGTASASEMVINSLKPYLNVKTVGARSYGKPVGFFPISIDKYDVYFSLFQTKNKLGQGEYFNGFAPDGAAKDDVSRDFGDANELSLASAISYITKGSFVMMQNALMSVKGVKMNAASVQLQNIGGQNDFKGMIETRVRLKN